jgi:hypothetical protein
MIRLKEDEIPVLEGKLMFNDKCYALGVSQEGIIVQYMEKDSVAYLIEWVDIIDVGEKEIAGSRSPIAISKPLPGQKGKRI